MKEQLPTSTKVPCTEGRNVEPDVKVKALTLAAIAERTGAMLVGDPECLISGVADLESATLADVSFVQPQEHGASAKGYLQAMQVSEAGVLFISPTMSQHAGRNYLVHSSPSRAFQEIVEYFHPPVPSGFVGIHPTAVLHPTVQLGVDVHVGPYAVIDQRAQIGDNSVIGAHSYIGAQVKIGRDCHLHAHTTIRESCVLGDRVIIQPGAVIGSCGFGYTQDKQGRSTKLKQLGNVILEDDVEVGANTAIDRGRFTSTTVRSRSKIDNLCQIAHGVQIGEDNLIAGQTGIAGSTKTGRNVIIGGQVAIKDHIELADHVHVGGRSGVMGSLRKPGVYVDTPARPYSVACRKYLALSRLERAYERISALEKAIAELKTD